VIHFAEFKLGRLREKRAAVTWNLGMNSDRGNHEYLRQNCQLQELEGTDFYIAV
jgi:hypothetical protein